MEWGGKKSKTVRGSRCVIKMLLAVENVEVYDSPGSYGRGPETHVVGNDMLIIGVPRAMRESLRISGRWDDENSRATVEFGGNSIKVQVVFTSERLLASGPFAATNTDCHCWMTPHVREMLRLTIAHAPERAGFENFSAKWSSVTVSVNALLFSYGSNGRKQLRGRIERPLDEPFQTYPACLTGYRRIFCGKSANWGGGFASVHPVIGGETYGNVASLSHKEFLKLDAFEGGYRRQVVTVNLQDSGESVQAITYIANDPTFVQPPSQAYLTAIQIMLRERDERECDTTIDRLCIGRDGNLQASSYFVSRPRDPTSYAMSAAGDRWAVEAPRVIPPRRAFPNHRSKFETGKTFQDATRHEKNCPASSAALPLSHDFTVFTFAAIRRDSGFTWAGRRRG